MNLENFYNKSMSEGSSSNLDKIFKIGMAEGSSLNLENFYNKSMSEGSSLDLNKISVLSMSEGSSHVSGQFFGLKQNFSIGHGRGQC